MSAKTSLARRRAFFAAVAETGNQTLAAERAKVSRSWVTLHRQTDPQFRAELDAAVALAKARLRGAVGVGPSPKCRSQKGEELVVNGSNGRRVQVRRANPRQWTPRLEARFLARLAEAANVHAACAAVGLSVPSAYNHRNRWADFARRWDTAVEFGCLRLEAAVIGEAGRLLGTNAMTDEEVDIPITGMTAAHALAVLRLRLKPYNTRRGRVGGPPAVADAETVRAVILNHVARIKRVRAWQDGGQIGAAAAGEDRRVAAGAAQAKVSPAKSPAVRQPSR
jgi:hypothetical protein